MYQFYRRLALSFIFLLAASLSFGQAPVISSFSPVTAAVGSSVTISGSNFSSSPSANIVYMGAVRATVTAATTTSLTVTVPPGTTYQPITVTTNNLTAYSTQRFAATITNGGVALGRNSFADRIDSTSGVNIDAIAIVDLDGDGKPDLAMSNNANDPVSTISVHRNTSSGGAVSFAPVQLLAARDKSIPNGIVASDLDGDGKPDLAVIMGLGVSVSFYRNTSTPGSISFAQRIDLDAGIDAYEVAAGDLNGDGKPDLAFTNFIKGTVSILKNISTPGNIAFDAKMDLGTGLGPHSVVIGDLDGDGKPELAVTNAFSSTVSVFRNQGSGGSMAFSAKNDLATASDEPSGLVIGDVDGDGKLDLVLSYQNFNKVTQAAVGFSILKNTGGSGTLNFAYHQDYGSGDCLNITLGDLNGDGKPEIVRPDASGGMAIYRNIAGPASPLLDQPVSYGIWSALCMAIGDLNGDNLPDIVGGDVGWDKVSLWTNQLFAPSITSISPAVAPSGATVTITGINFDGATAVSFGGVAAASFSVVSSTSITAVVGSGASGEISVTTPKGTAVFDHFEYVLPPTISSFSPDSAGTGSVVSIIGKELGGVTAVSFGGIAATSFTIKNDTLITAVVASGATGAVSVTAPGGTASRNGFGFVAAPTIISFYPASAGAGDTITITGTNLTGTSAVSFGGIAATSFVVNSSSVIRAVVGGGAGGSVAVGTKGGTATLAGFSFVFAVTPTITGFTPDSGRIGVTVTISGTNFDPVSANNIVYFGAVRAQVISSSSSSISVTVPAGAMYKPISVTTSGNHLTAYSAKSFRTTFDGGTIHFAPKVSYGQDYFYGSVAVGDLDGDGKLDVISSPFGGPGAVVLYQNQSSPGSIKLQQSGDPYGFSNNNPTTIVADMDGDGKQDVMVCGFGDIFYYYRNISTVGHLALADVVAFNTGYSASAMAIGDIDGDGRPDIVTTNSFRNVVVVYRNASVPGVFALASRVEQAIGRVPMAVAVGDIDGDGKLDIAACNSTDNTVSIVRNLSVPGSILFGSTVSYATGPNPSTIALGDLNQDGRPDMAITHLDENGVRIYRNTSSSGVASFADGQFYNTPFIVSAPPGGVSFADLNGDGKPEVTISNSLAPGSISVYENRSSSSTLDLLLVPNIYFLVGDKPRDVVMADLDGDGRPDACTANGGFTVLRNESGEEPYIYSITPNAAVEGDSVTLTGKNFVNVSSVSFGEDPATGYRVVSSTTIRAAVGEGTSGVVTVVTPKGTATLDGFIYAAAPAVNVYSPYQGVIGGTIMLTGNNFIGVTAVSFGGVPAASFKILSTHSIEAVLGDGGSGDVSVTNPYGTGTAAGFNFLRIPTITSFTPKGGPAGATITLTGTNFTGANSVKFGDVEAASFVVVSATTIQAVVGAGASGYVSVSSGIWTGVLAGFVFNPAPSISVSGDTVFCSGGSVTLTASVSANLQWYKDGAAIGGSTGQSLKVTESGQYAVTTRYDNKETGLSTPVKVVVNVTPSKPSIHWDANYGMVSSVIADGNQWYSDPSTPIPGATDVFYRPSGEGIFYLRVTQNGCAGPLSDAYHYLVTATINLGGPDKWVRVAPNPVVDQVYISFGYPGIYSLGAELSDVQGRVLVTASDVRSGDRIGVSSLAKGEYFLRLRSRDGKVNVVTAVLKL